MGSLIPFAAEVSEMTKPLADYMSLRSAVDAYNNMFGTGIYTFLVKGTFDKHMLGAIRSTTCSLMALGASPKHKVRVDQLIAEANKIEQTACNDMLKYYGRLVSDAQQELDAAMSISFNSDGTKWTDHLDNNPSWKALCAVAKDSVCKLDPKKVSNAEKSLMAAVACYADAASSFDMPVDTPDLITAKSDAITARAALTLGASVALLARPLSDKVAQHRALQTQLKAALDPRIAASIPNALVTQLRKAVRI